MHRLTLAAVCLCAVVRAGFAQNWDELQKLTASDGATSDGFGAAVDVQGDVAAISAQTSNAGKAGEVYVFERSGGVWSQAATLVPPDGEAGDGFGCSVSVSGETIFVGAYTDDDHGPSSGSVYVFDRAGSQWKYTAKLTPADGAQADIFGTSVSLDGDTAFVGEPYDDDHGTNSGAAHVYQRTAGKWSHVVKLAPGSLFSGDDFGRSVALSQNYAIVGADLDDDVMFNSGAAYIYEFVRGNWTAKAKVVAPDGGEIDHFGYSVGIDGSVAVVGAFASDGAATESGAAYVFERVAGTWIQTAKLVPPDPEMFGYFGISVSVSAGHVLVGSSAGAAYMFENLGGGWKLAARLEQQDSPDPNGFGFKVSVDGDSGLIGASSDDQVANGAGAAYVFGRTQCVGDFDGNGIVDTRDVLAFLNSWTKLDKAADIDGNGIIDTRDVLAFLNRWAAGC
ncbi:MAG: hypothetical protein IPJ41_13135 [Phycisphaerales bacterium]|nr:hypothetical protein [Phycisphaerales bacterium]